MAGTLITSTIQGTTLTDGTNSTSTTNCIKGSAKAWVRFSVSGTTPTIVNSYNISSITYNASGYYSVAFTNSMSNANYIVVSNGSINTSLNAFVNAFSFANNSSGSYYTAPTTSGFTVGYVSSIFENPLYSNISVFSS